jgi:hypothetical protein
MRRPDPATPRGPLSSARERLRGARYFADDLLYVAGRLPRAVAGRGGLGGGRLSGRLVAAVGALVIVLVAAAVAVPRLPCGFPGGDSCPPADDAEHLVPADALAYVHVNLDQDGDQYDRAARIADVLPLLSGQLVGRALAQVPGPDGGSADFDQDLRPWLGDEAALAVVGSGATAERVDLLEADDEQRAAEFAEAIGAAGAVTQDYEGVEIAVDRRGIATAQVDGFLVVGTREGVRAVVRAATGPAGPGTLADDGTASGIRDQLPDERLVDAYVSGRGARRLVAASGGVLGALAPLLTPGAARGAAAALVATDDGLELAVRSALDPERTEAAPGLLAAFPRFQPTLAARLPPETLGYIGIGEPRTSVPALARRAAEASGLAAGLADLVDDLRHASSRQSLGDLVAGLGDEAALALEPRAGRATSALPYLELVAGGVDERTARRALAALGDDSARSRELAGGVAAHEVRLSPAIDLTYAVFDGIAALAGDPAGIEALAAGDGALERTDLYKRATGGFGTQASLIAFVDITGLVALGERLGLGEDPLYATFAGEFRHLEALAARVDYDGEVIATDMRLLVSGQGAAAGGSAAAAADEAPPGSPPSD